MNKVAFTLSPRFDAQHYKVLHRREVGSNFYQLEELTIEHATFQGPPITLKRDLLIKQDAVAVLLYDAALDAVVLIEQFRVGAVADTQSPWLFEIVAGMCEDTESEQQVARREALEETGLTVEQLVPIIRYTPSPGGVQEFIALYFAQVDASSLTPYHGLEEEGEDIKVHLIDFCAAMQMLNRGLITTSPAIIALQWLALHKNNLPSADVLEDSHDG